VVRTQLPDGSFADQGGTVGIHAAMNLIVKPWMGCIATEAMVDYLACAPDEEIERSALVFSRWLLACRVRDEHGLIWPYQISHGGAPVTYRMDGTTTPLLTNPLHNEYLAKILVGRRCARTTRSSTRRGGKKLLPTRGAVIRLGPRGEQNRYQSVRHARSLWGARFISGRVTVQPRSDLAPDLAEAMVSTPDGPLVVHPGDRTHRARQADKER